MDEIRIVSGIKRIAIRDENDEVIGEISFNPSDVNFAERFYGIFHEFQSKNGEYERKAKEFDAANKLVDENGIPKHFVDGIAFMREVCEFVYAKIDELFGVGTSEKVFRGAMDIELIGQFFDGITPFIQKARADKINKYVGDKTGKVLK